MNSRLAALHPYPFEKLRRLLAGVQPPADLSPVDLSIGEPKHAPPTLAVEAMLGATAGLSGYPPTKGDPALRSAMSQWIARRYGIPPLNPDTQILPILGSREALFSFAQVVVDSVSGRAADGATGATAQEAEPAYVICPNPFYQIYEGAALLAGAEPWYLNARPELDHGYAWEDIPVDVLRNTQLMYVCSPGNPTGRVLQFEDWKRLFELSDEYGFIIAADECYSEIYFDEARPPLGGLEAAVRLKRNDFRRLVSFSSLSKRSSLPGLRSGYVAGDATILERFLLYRTYHGSAMSLVTAKASIAAWNDEDHVVENRRLYRDKLESVLPVLQPVLDVQRPEAAFFLWAGTPYEDTKFVRDLYAATGVITLPGSYLARESQGTNPGRKRIRIALVAPHAQCVEAAQRVAQFCSISSNRNI